MKVGLICDTSYQSSRHCLSFFYAIKNIFNDVTLIKDKRYLEKIDLLIIGDNLFMPHRQVWENLNFIETVNNLDISVCVFTMEKIYCEYYSHNTVVQKNLELFKNLKQYVIDVEDSILLNKKIVRALVPKHYEFLRRQNEKKDAICFIGQLTLPYYEKRLEIINKIGSKYNVDVMERSSRSFEEYMNILSSYRYVLNPPSTQLNGFSGRLYETLLVKSIPLQFIYDNTLDYHPIEKSLNDIIFFKNVDELIEKLENFTLLESETCEWFEDEIIKLLREDMIL